MGHPSVEQMVPARAALMATVKVATWVMRLDVNWAVHSVLVMVDMSVAN
jgi:hypothetical protein